ncbi:MAG: hypothetical protein MI974_11525 [Chitinophagales bacterium]|nr:hypothetical protein [Chitinophagales bacterium]
MNIQLSTLVSGNYRDIIQQFDLQLFEALAPPLVKMEIVEFTGSEKGDNVHVRFLKPVRTEWKSEITASEITKQQAYFTDEGTILPWPLYYWKHIHIVEKVTDNTSRIIDDIHFKGNNAFLTLLLYPLLFLSFYPRKKIYRKYFGKPQ